MSKRERRPDGVQEQLWRERIGAWRGSGQTQSQFCQAHGLAVSSFSRWKSELQRREEAEAPAAASSMRTSPDASESISAPLSWTEVGLPALRGAGVVPDSEVFEVLLPWGWSVRLGPRFEAEALRRLLSVLQERSC